MTSRSHHHRAPGSFFARLGLVMARYHALVFVVWALVLVGSALLRRLDAPRRARGPRVARGGRAQSHRSRAHAVQLEASRTVRLLGALARNRRDGVAFALDLLVICAEAGLTVTGFVRFEVGQA